MTITLTKDFFSTIDNVKLSDWVDSKEGYKFFSFSEKLHYINQATVTCPISFNNIEEIALIRVRLNRVNHFIEYLESNDIKNITTYTLGRIPVTSFKAKLETLFQGLPNLTEEQILLAEKRINDASKALAGLSEPLLNIVSILRNIELPKSPKIDHLNTLEYCNAMNAMNAMNNCMYEEQRDNLLAWILEASGKPGEPNSCAFPLDRVEDVEDIACIEIRLRRVEHFIRRLKCGETYRLDPNKNNQQLSEITPEALMTLVDALRYKLPKISEKEIQEVKDSMHREEHGMDCVIS